VERSYNKLFCDELPDMTRLFCKVPFPLYLDIFSRDITKEFEWGQGACYNEVSLYKLELYFMADISQQDTDANYTFVK